MKNRPPTTAHNYVRAGIAFLESKQLPPQLALLTIAHDDWCDMLNGCGHCNCDPEFILKALPTPENN